MPYNYCSVEEESTISSPTGDEAYFKSKGKIPIEKIEKLLCATGHNEAKVVLSVREAPH